MAHNMRKHVARACIRVGAPAPSPFPNRGSPAVPPVALPPAPGRPGSGAGILKPDWEKLDFWATNAIDELSARVAAKELSSGSDSVANDGVNAISPSCDTARARWLSAPLLQMVTPPGPKVPGGSARRYWNRYGRQGHHPGREPASPRRPRTAFASATR